MSAIESSSVQKHKPKCNKPTQLDVVESFRALIIYRVMHYLRHYTKKKYPSFI